MSVSNRLAVVHGLSGRGAAAAVRRAAGSGLTALGCGLLVTGCVSAVATDLRLAALGRAAVPLSGQSVTQQVVDASDCRERVMDGLFYMGAYTLYNPLATWSGDDAIRARERLLAACLAARGYRVDGTRASPPLRQ